MAVENRWAEPEGYEQGPPPVRYRIRDESGEVVERETSVAYDHGRQRYYHALGAKDQHFADEIVTLIQAACAYFHAAESEYEPLEGVPEMRITDDEVAARIERLERGENTREAERTRMTYYPLTDLPFEQQRALVEQIESLKQRWRFEILGEAVAAAS